MPQEEQMTIYDAAIRYQAEQVPLVVVAGREYGSGSSRDWAAKGTPLLGVRAVIAVSYERIHRSNLVGMGVLPLQFAEGGDADSLGIDGSERSDIGSPSPENPDVAVTATHKSGKAKTFCVGVRIDTPKGWDYDRHGGILRYVVRDLAQCA
jgi:aconitate hydratase